MSGRKYGFAALTSSCEIEKKSVTQYRKSSVKA